MPIDSDKIPCQAIQCRNYPTEEFSSFSDCDSQFVRREDDAAGVVPFWAAEDLAEVTNITVKPPNYDELLLWNLFDGSLESNCHKPCLSTKVIGSELSEKRSEDLTTLIFSFDPEVVISVSQFPDFNWTTFFTDLGGSLGLWLGLGVSQLLELFLRNIFKMSSQLSGEPSPGQI